MTNTIIMNTGIDDSIGRSRYGGNTLIKDNGTRKRMEWIMKQPEVIHFTTLKNIVQPFNASTKEHESCVDKESAVHQERRKISEARAADAIRHLTLDENVRVEYEVVGEYTIRMTLEADTVSQLDKAYEMVSKACWSQVLDHTTVISDHCYEQESINKILDIETDAQLNIDKHTITVSCPNVQGMWQALAQANCIAKGNGILHKVDVNVTSSLMEKREEWWRKSACLVSIVNPILFVDDVCDDDTDDDNENNNKLLIYIEGSEAESVKREIDRLTPENNGHLGLQLNPWEHAFLLHQYDKVLQSCDQRGAVLVLNGLDLQCINAQSISFIDDILLSLASTTIPIQINSSFYFVDQNVTYMDKVPNTLSLATMYRSMEDHDFTCGKKNGKLHRIQNDTGCTIQVGDLNPSNDQRGTRKLIGFRITGNKVSEASQALIGEFPAECTFYIPEEHHKRLIGYGGQTIQGLMKRHGVYVKFVSQRRASSQEYEKGGPFGSALTGNLIGGTANSSIWRDNVVVRTPRKNSLVLERVKKELLEMADLPTTTKEYTPRRKLGEEMILVDKQALLSLQNFKYHNSIVIKSWLLDVSSVKVSVTVDRLQPMIKVH